MPLPVSLELVAQELDGFMDEETVLINRRTGEIVRLSNEELALGEEDVDESDLPDWQIEMLPKLREIALREDWAPLPDKFEIHEWEIMRDYAESVDDEDLAERLQRAIHGRGAFRMFRTTIEDAGMRDDWFRFKHDALKDIAREALEHLGIPYK